MALRLERNQEATVWVGGLAEEVDEPLLWELMIQAGPIITVNIPRDRVTGEHQGYAFVEFASEEDADYAIKVLNMIQLFNKPIKINKASRDKKDNGVGANLYIGNLDPEVDDTMLYNTFSAFGQVLSAKVMYDEASESRGFGFVNFADFESSDLAIRHMNQQYLCNRCINVSYAFKKDSTSGERHGTEAERRMAAKQKSKRPHFNFSSNSRNIGKDNNGNNNNNNNETKKSFKTDSSNHNNDDDNNNDDMNINNDNNNKYNNNNRHNYNDNLHFNESKSNDNNNNNMNGHNMRNGSDNNQRDKANIVGPNMTNLTNLTQAQQQHLQFQQMQHAAVAAMFGGVLPPHLAALHGSLGATQQQQQPHTHLQTQLQQQAPPPQQHAPPPPIMHQFNQMNQMNQMSQLNQAPPPPVPTILGLPGAARLPPHLAMPTLQNIPPFFGQHMNPAMQAMFAAQHAAMAHNNQQNTNNNAPPPPPMMQNIQHIPNIAMAQAPPPQQQASMQPQVQPPQPPPQAQSQQQQQQAPSEKVEQVIVQPPSFGNVATKK